MTKHDKMNYDALEKINDGEAFASEYDSQQMEISQLNMVMVFSNFLPVFKWLAKVWFRVFTINNNHVQNGNVVEIKSPTGKKKKVESDSDVDSEISNGYDL